MEKAKRLKPNEIIKPGIFTIIDSMPSCPSCFSVHIQAKVVKHGPKSTNAVHFTCQTCYCEWIVAPEDELSAWEFCQKPEAKAEPVKIPSFNDLYAKVGERMGETSAYARTMYNLFREWVEKELIKPPEPPANNC